MTLTRRDFIKSVGALGAIGVVGGVSWPYESRVAVRSMGAVRADFQSFFIGVGNIGRRLDERLANAITGYLPFLKFYPHGSFNDQLVFIAGQTDDPILWKVRDRVLSQEPYLLFTLVNGQFPFQPETNEGVITFDGNDMKTACHTILHLNAAATIPTMIGLDLGDIRMVFGGGLLETFHFGQKTEFKKAMQNHFGSPHGFMVILCYRDPDLMECKGVEVVIDALECHYETDILLGIDWHSQSDSEVVVISRTIPRCMSPERRKARATIES